MSLANSGAIRLAPQRFQAPLLNTLETFQITNPAEFLATVYYESEYLTRLVESLNYTSDALLKRFSRRRISYADALKYGRSQGRPAQQENIANCIYGGQWGLEHLGNFQPGDGWHYRGMGAIQLTGRANWERFANYLGRPDVLHQPQMVLMDPLLTCYTAGWFWAKYKNLNACGSDMRAITKRVTGAADTAIKTRLAYRDRVLQLM